MKNKKSEEQEIFKIKERDPKVKGIQELLYQAERFIELGDKELENEMWKLIIKIATKNVNNA